MAGPACLPGRGSGVSPTITASRRAKARMSRKPRLGIRRRQGHDGGIRLEDAEHRGDVADRTVHVEPDSGAFDDAARAQGLRDSVGIGLETSVA